MTYLSEQKKQEREDRRARLLKLWSKCETLPEFWVKQAVEVPNATWHERTCFKLHAFKKEHSALWHIFCVVAVLSYLVATTAIVVILLSEHFGTAVLLCSASTVLSMLVSTWFLDFMHEIDLHENGYYYA